MNDPKFFAADKNAPMAPGENDASLSLRDLFLAMTLGALAFWLRFSIESANFLGIDEAFQLFISTRSSLREAFSTINSLGPQQYPLDYLLSFWAARWTSDIHALRLLPIIWGTLSVVTTYFIGKLILNRFFGWTWAFLLCFSTIHVEYSLEFRHYSLAVFLSALSLFFFLKLILSEDADRRWFWLYSLTNVLTLFSYPFAGVKFLVELFMIWKLKPRSLLPVLAGALLPLIFLATKAIQLSINSPFHFQENVIFSLPILSNLFLRFSQDSTIRLIFYVVSFLAGVGLSFRFERNKLFFHFLLVVFISTLAAIFLALFHSKLFFNPRHALPLLPIYLGFVALPCADWSDRLHRRFKTHSRFIGFSFSAALSLLIFLMSADPIKQGVEWRRKINDQIKFMAASLSEKLKLGDVIIFGDPNFGATLLYSVDSEAFKNLAGVKLSSGIDLFRFPKVLRVQTEKSTNDVYTLCSFDRELETMSEPALASLIRRITPAGSRVWFPYLPFKYTPHNMVQQLSDVPSIKLIETEPGIFQLTGTNSDLR